MRWLRDLAERPPPDVGERTGAERVGYRLGQGIVLVTTAAVIALPLAWLLVLVAR
jgi:hypothetical protein